MSRRSRYARSQHAGGRPPRLASPRPITPGPAQTTAPRPQTNGHFTPEPAAPLPVLEIAPAVEPSNGHGEPLASAVASNGHAPTRPDVPGCTAPQLRRFIKSRTYVPMHELRRRFSINGTEDDVTAVETDGRRIFVGLPPREGRLLGELLRAGDVGYELSLDPRTPIVVGVYPMRPVPRP